jgi:long-chain acyl-CoA synthetase
MSAQLAQSASAAPAWAAAYPPGVRWNAPIAVGPVQQVLDIAAATWPDQPALDFMGRRISYRELDRLASRAAKGLQALGVKPGVHVGLYLPNTPHYMVAFFGVMRAGGTVVNYSPLDAEKVLEHKVGDSETDILLTLDLALLLPQMQRLLGSTRLRHLVVGDLAEMAAHPDAVRAALVQGGQISSWQEEPRISGFEQLLDNDGDYTPCPAGDPRDSVAVLQYTGGTTGLPKGAMLTHANLTAAVSQFLETVSGDTRVLELGQERILAVLPPFHIFALTLNMLFGIRIGAEVILHTRFDVPAVLKDLAEKKVTVFPGVPTMFTAILAHPGVAQLNLRTLKYCGTGGAPLPVEVNDRFKALTGASLNEGWGMTETSPTGTFTPIVGRRRAGSCGLPMPGISIRLLSVEDGRSWVPAGERGEICIQGPNVMKGYWKNPGATAEVMTADGYLRTGDVGVMDEDGFIRIVDRTKDMILCAGFNVYPRNLEEAIHTHPAVAEVCVIGIPDDYRGQSPKAFVVIRPGAPAFTLDELKVFLKDKLGKHEMVQALEIRADLPRTAVGKLSKKDLVEEEKRKRAGLNAA